VSLSDKIVLPSPYHWSKLQEWVSGVSALRTQVGVVEEYLATASAQAAQTAATHAAFASPQSLSRVLSAHHAALLSLTSRIAALHESVAAVRDKFVAMFGREGAVRLEEERAREAQRKEAFDLNAPNSQLQPLVSSTAQATSLQAQSVTAGAPAAAAAGTAPALTFGTASAASAGTAGGLSFGTTAPAAGGLSFGSTAPAAGAATFGGFSPTGAAGGSAWGNLPPTTQPLLQTISKSKNKKK